MPFFFRLMIIVMDSGRPSNRRYVGYARLAVVKLVKEVSPIAAPIPLIKQVCHFAMGLLLWGSTVHVAATALKNRESSYAAHIVNLA
jgi:hypothetical protein